MSAPSFAAGLAWPPPERAALFFDIDGTLLDLRPHPLDVVADSEMLLLMSELLARTSGAVAVVSGRAIDDIDRVFAPLRLAAGGIHGVQIRFSDGSGRHGRSEILDQARPHIVRFVENNPGLLLEDKGAGIAVHYRQRPEMGDEVIRFMNALAPGDKLAVQGGKLVVELKPPAFDKGTVIAEFLAREPFKGRVPVFIGDDLTDEKGFVAVNAVGGLSIRVGSGPWPTQARDAIPDPAAVRARLVTFLNTTLPEDERGTSI